MKLLAAATLLFAPFTIAQSLAGLWDATVKVRELEVPFRFEISGDGSKIAGTFFNGEAKFVSSSGSLNNGSLLINWDYTASKLEATVHDGGSKASIIERDGMRRRFIHFRRSGSLRRL